MHTSTIWKKTYTEDQFLSMKSKIKLGKIRKHLRGLASQGKSNMKYLFKKKDQIQVSHVEEQQEGTQTKFVGRNSQEDQLILSIVHISCKVS